MLDTITCNGDKKEYKKGNDTFGLHKVFKKRYEIKTEFLDRLIHDK